MMARYLKRADIAERFNNKPKAGVCQALFDFLGGKLGLAFQDDEKITDGIRNAQNSRQATAIFKGPIKDMSASL